jgi:hypothetical protein
MWVKWRERLEECLGYLADEVFREVSEVVRFRNIFMRE